MHSLRGNIPRGDEASLASYLEQIPDSRKGDVSINDKGPIIRRDPDQGSRERWDLAEDARIRSLLRFLSVHEARYGELCAEILPKDSVILEKKSNTVDDITGRL